MHSPSFFSNICVNEYANFAEEERKEKKTANFVIIRFLIAASECECIRLHKHINYGSIDLFWDIYDSHNLLFFSIHGVYKNIVISRIKCFFVSKKKVRNMFKHLNSTKTMGIPRKLI